MKITFVVPTLNISGGLRVVSIYAERLSQKGHDVTIVYPQEASPSFKQRVKHFLNWKGYQFNSQFNSSYFDNVDYKVKITSNIQRVSSDDVPDADIVIATWWEIVEWISEFPSAKGLPIYFVQGLDTYNRVLPTERVEASYQSSIAKITIAKWLVEQMQEKSTASVALVPNSVDHALFYGEPRGKQSSPTIGFLFSETGSKGVAIALQVMARLKVEIPDLRVLCFGAHPAKLIQLPDYIEFTINPAQEEVRKLYTQCDVWLCCSTLEGFGLTVLEAMACRTPAVSTKCGGPEDMVTEGVNGYLCDVDDVARLTLATKEILTLETQAWKAFSNAAYDFSNSYSWDDAADLFEAALINSLKVLKN